MITAGTFDIDIMQKVIATGLFSDRVFQLTDPGSLIKISEGLNLPICGVVYEGISSGGDDGDLGSAAYLSVGLIILTSSKVRQLQQTVDSQSVADVLDGTREAIGRTKSPSDTWEFVVEVPFELSERDMGFYQKWRTQVSI
jgi:hypothetical protein